MEELYSGGDSPLIRREGVRKEKGGQQAAPLLEM
jgi:hypothetical protein